MWTNENRGRYDRSKLRYPSDLTDEEWALSEPLIPAGKRGGNRRTVNVREVVNGLMYVLSTGCQWRAIPKDLPPRSTVYDYFDLWSWDGTLDRIHEAQAKERYARERAEHEAKLAARAAKTAATGKKPGGKPPAPPVEGPLPKDQINLTDADSRIMPASGGGFEQSYNAQAVVAAGSLLVVAADVVQAPNDKQQLEPMLDKIEALPERLGAVETLLADAGYFSAANVEACREARLEPLIAIGREPHHPPLDERFAKERPAPENPTPVEAMAHRLKTPEGRKLYALRKQTPEPVFGIIKSALGFRQFSLRGLDKVRAEWSLVTMAWNLKRMFVLAPAPA